MDVVLGMDAISALGGVFVRTPDQLHFGSEQAHCAAIHVSEADFDIGHGPMERKNGQLRGMVERVLY